MLSWLGFNNGNSAYSYEPAGGCPLAIATPWEASHLKQPVSHLLESRLRETATNTPVCFADPPRSHSYS